LQSLYRITAPRHPRRYNGEGEEIKVKGGRIEYMNGLQEWKGKVEKEGKVRREVDPRKCNKRLNQGRCNDKRGLQRSLSKSESRGVVCLTEGLLALLPEILKGKISKQWK
jgi:hypothetical protein